MFGLKFLFKSTKVSHVIFCLSWIHFFWNDHPSNASTTTNMKKFPIWLLFKYNGLNSDLVYVGASPLQPSLYEPLLKLLVISNFCSVFLLLIIYTAL